MIPCRDIIINILLPVLPDQGLDCYVSESSRVFFIKFQSFSYFNPMNFYIT
jgi:hypothetical protein